MNAIFKTNEQIDTLQLKSISYKENSSSQNTPFLFQLDDIPTVCDLRDSVIPLESSRYIGCKQKLIDWIFDIIKAETSDIHIVTDIFAGTGVVAKKIG